MFSRSFSFVSCWHSHDMNKTESIPIRFQYLFPQTIPDQPPDQKTIITCGPCTGMAAFRSKLAYSVCWLFALLPDSAHKTLMLRPNSRLEIQDSRGFLQEKTVLRHSPNLQKPCTRKRELSKRAKPMTHARLSIEPTKKLTFNSYFATPKKLYWGGPLQAGAPAEQHAAPGAPAMGIACVKDLMSWLRPTALRLPSQ